MKYFISKTHKTIRRFDKFIKCKRRCYFTRGFGYLYLGRYDGQSGKNKWYLKIRKLYKLNPRFE